METMKDVIISIAEIYVPTKRRKTLDPGVVEDLAADILENGQREPILVRKAEERKDGARYVLVEGLHRLEACRALGEATTVALIVHARRR
jgi:ParB-like chromosome segregation protein Spo0J